MSTGLIGQTLQKQFRVDAFVAAGGMGAVYRVWDLKRNVSLAMKVLHADLAEDPSIMKRFLREANALKKLQHPNIVPFYGLHKEPDFVFLLQKYIDGPTLKQVLRLNPGQPLDLDQALIYLKGVSAALGYAHIHGVVHCDVKPGNVMLDQGGSIYLADFGIVRHAESTTTTLGFAGTAAYMAPEQCRAEAVTPQTDIYALSIMFYEMLAGRRPFIGSESGTESAGATAAERIRYAHMFIPPADPSMLNPQIPRPLAEVMLKGLSKDASDRYTTTHELTDMACKAAGRDMLSVPDHAVVPKALQQRDTAGPGGPPYGSPPGVAPVPEPSPLKRYLLLGIPVVLIGGIVFVIALVIGGLLLFGGRKPADTPAYGEPPAESAEIIPQPSTADEGKDESSDAGEPEESVVIVTATDLPTPTAGPTDPPMPTETPKPEGPIGQIVYACYFATDQVCIMDADGSNPRQLTNVAAANFYPSLGPDGRSVVFATNRNGSHEIFLVDAITLEERRLTNSGYSYAPSISPDGTKIVYSHTETATGSINIYMMNIDGSNKRQMTFDSGGNHSEDPEWSPDGSQISFVSSRGGPFQLYVMNADGSNPRSLTWIEAMGGRNDWSPDGKEIAFYAGISGERQVYKVNVSSGEVTQLTNKYDNKAPSYSPDGEWIVYASRPTVDDDNAIWIMRPDGSDQQQITFDNHPNWQPRWGPDQ
jgi:serine/threonine-protein kinase